MVIFPSIDPLQEGSTVITLDTKTESGSAKVMTLEVAYVAGQLLRSESVTV